MGHLRCCVIKRGGVDGPGITLPRPSTLALIGFGIVVVGVTAYTVTRPGPTGHIQSAVAESGVVGATASSSAAPASVLATTATQHPSASTSTTPAPTPKPPATSLRVTLPKGPVTAIVFGDSYVAGVGASSTRDAFAERAISQLGGAPRTPRGLTVAAARRTPSSRAGADSVPARRRYQ